jgi:hypothetical protein
MCSSSQTSSPAWPEAMSAARASIAATAAGYSTGESEMRHSTARAPGGGANVVKSRLWRSLTIG